MEKTEGSCLRATCSHETARGNPEQLLLLGPIWNNVNLELFAGTSPTPGRLRTAQGMAMPVPNAGKGAGIDGG